MLTLQTKASKKYTIIVPETEHQCNQVAMMAGNLAMETGLEFLIPWNEKDTTEFVVQCVKDPSKCAFVAVDNMNYPVGFVCGGIAQSFINKTIIQAVEFGWFVYPEYRGTGVGIDLHKRYEEWAESAGADVISMMHMNNPQVGRMYEKMGYSLTELSYSRKVN